MVIKRGGQNAIRRLSPNEAADQFFAQTHFPSTLIPHGGEVPAPAADNPQSSILKTASKPEQSQPAPPIPGESSTK